MTADVPAFPFARTDPFGLPPELATLREEQPISRVRIWDGSEPWLVTSFELAREVLGSRRFSSDADRPGFPNASPERRNVTLGRTLIRMDPPEHTRFRRMLNPEFVIQRVEAMRPEVQRIADDLLDAMTGSTPPADLVQSFALPLPSLVICHLLGVPRSDRPFFEERARKLVTIRPGQEQGRIAFEELRAYMDRLVTAKHADPGDDVLTRLAERERAGELTHEEVVDTARLLLLAGHFTTANMIALGALVLLRDGGRQFVELRRDPSLVKGAVEELLRHMTLIQSGLRRVATEDVEIGGERIRAGEGVIVHIAAANRDATFAEPERFDVHHEVRHHLAFGYGFHQCLGQLLARIELQVALVTLVRRFPNLAIAVPMDQVRWREDGFIHGVHELPVTW